MRFLSSCKGCVQSVTGTENIRAKNLNFAKQRAFFAKIFANGEDRKKVFFLQVQILRTSGMFRKTFS
jgi:hypothetical protein